MNLIKVVSTLVVNSSLKLWCSLGTVVVVRDETRRHIILLSLLLLLILISLVSLRTSSILVETKLMRIAIVRGVLSILLLWSTCHLLIRITRYKRCRHTLCFYLFKLVNVMLIAWSKLCWLLLLLRLESRSRWLTLLMNNSRILLLAWWCSRWFV